MARKVKIAWDWLQFWPQLVAVILGVMITFIGSDLIASWQRERQIKEMMLLIVEELQINLKSVDNVKFRVNEDRRGMLMFQRYDFEVEAIAIDSLNNCGLEIGTAAYYRTQDDALEVLKSSGYISSIKDKRLLMDILRCYTSLNGLADLSDDYFNRKLSAVDHIFANPSELNLRKDDPRANWKYITDDPVCKNFIASTANFFGAGDENTINKSYEETTRVIEQIKRTYE